MDSNTTGNRSGAPIKVSSVNKLKINTGIAVEIFQKSYISRQS